MHSRSQPNAEDEQELHNDEHERDNADEKLVRKKSQHRSQKKITTAVEATTALTESNDMIPDEELMEDDSEIVSCPAHSKVSKGRKKHKNKGKRSRHRTKKGSAIQGSSGDRVLARRSSSDGTTSAMGSSEVDEDEFAQQRSTPSRSRSVPDDGEGAVASQRSRSMQGDKHGEKTLRKSSGQRSSQPASPSPSPPLSSSPPASLFSRPKRIKRTLSSERVDLRQKDEAAAVMARKHSTGSARATMFQTPSQSMSSYEVRIRVDEQSLQQT